VLCRRVRSRFPASAKRSGNLPRTGEVEKVHDSVGPDSSMEKCCGPRGV
jgi:hypothetical protein